MITIQRVERQVTEEQEKNWEVARQINRETRANPDSPYTDKYIGVLNQGVVAVGDTLDEVCVQLKILDATFSQAVVIEANADYDRTFMIWSLG